MKDIISILQEAISVPDGVFFESKDGTNIHITLEDACTLVSVHDTLTQDNQVKIQI